MEIPFIGGAYKDKSLNLNTQDCVNWYPVLDQQEGKTPIALYPTPGLNSFCDTSHTAEVRCLYKMQSYLFAVVGNKFFRITTGGVATEVDTINTSTGIVQMSDNGIEILVTDGTDGFLYDYSGGTLTQITDADFPTPSSNTFQDGYFIVTKDDTGEIYISALYDGSDWDALDYATAEGNPDYALKVINSHRELWVYGEKTIELYYNSGNTTFPFERFNNIILESGLGAVNSVAKLDNSLFWLDEKYQIVRSEGYAPKIISTRQIEYQISTYTTKSDAIAFGFTQEGHTFYQISFPTDGYTWVYDCATGYWHRRTSYPSNGRHRANCYAFFNDKHLVGDHTNGIIYELDPDTYTDDGYEIHRIRITQSIHKQRRNIFFNRLELEFEAGVGLSTGLATGTAVISGGAVTSVTINDGGSGYTTEPWVRFSGGQGVGALATTTLTAGVVTAVTIVNGGSGYTSAPTVTFVGGTQDPQAMLKYSDDGGHTWSNERWQSMGKIGEYNNLAIWDQLGCSRERVWDLRVTDSVKPVLLAAYLEAEVGYH